MNHTSPAITTLQQRLLTSVAFLREWVRSPRAIGMVCPSGTELARAMAERIPKNSTGLVIEIGAGTGTVTRELVRTGIAPQRLLIIERAPGMAKLLHHRFPSLAIVQGDAAELPDYLPPASTVDCIVSSLPLISLPAEVRQKILNAMKVSLRSGGTLIQYTYSWSGSNHFFRDSFRLVDSQRIWHNVPPARVFRFVRL